MNNKQNNKKGFTLVEIMVSVAIFSVIMTTGIGALVSITNSYKISQDNKKVNDALNYTLETITRELRIGSTYNAGTTDDSNQIPDDGVEDSIGFIAGDNRGYIVFRLDNNGVIYRDQYINGSTRSDALTNPDEVEISLLRFTVIGSSDLTNNSNFQQPLVWIQIQASPPGLDGTTSTIQTLVSQRILDV